MPEIANAVPRPSKTFRARDLFPAIAVPHTATGVTATTPSMPQKMLMHLDRFHCGLNIDATPAGKYMYKHHFLQMSGSNANG